MNQEHRISPAGESPKTPERPQPDKPVRMVVVEQLGGVHQVYANHITLSYTGHDVQLWFGEIARLPEIVPSDEPTTRLEQKCKVTLAWSEAKACRELLSDLITKLEGANGPINPTPTVP